MKIEQEEGVFLLMCPIPWILYFSSRLGGGLGFYLGSMGPTILAGIGSGMIIMFALGLALTAWDERRFGQLGVMLFAGLFGAMPGIDMFCERFLRFSVI